jgi:hypothetical protein
MTTLLALSLVQLAQLEVKAGMIYRGTVEYQFKDDDEEIDLRYIDEVEYRVEKVEAEKVEIHLRRKAKSLWLDGQPAATGAGKEWSAFRLVRSSSGPLLTFEGPSQDLPNDARIERLVLLAPASGEVSARESFGGARWGLTFDSERRKFSGTFRETTLDRPIHASLKGVIDDAGWVTELVATTVGPIAIPGSDDERAKLMVTVRVERAKR